MKSHDKKLFLLACSIFRPEIKSAICYKNYITILLDLCKLYGKNQISYLPEINNQQSTINQQSTMKCAWLITIPPI